MPLRTRCRASAHARSGRPTIAKEGRAVLVDVGLDLDAARLEADECVGDRACEHASTLRGETVTTSSSLSNNAVR